jgi:hypothetical protein
MFPHNKRGNNLTRHGRFEQLPTEQRLSGKTGRDLVERRPRPILGRTRRPADVNKAGDALVRF